MSNLTAQDLQVGNTFEFSIERPIVKRKEVSIDEKDIEHYISNIDMFNQWYLPIPINETFIRERTNAIQKPRNEEGFYLIGRSEIQATTTGFYAKVMGIEKHYKYLHQLQQLCRLAGEELIIKTK